MVIHIKLSGVGWFSFLLERIQIYVLPLLDTRRLSEGCHQFQVMAPGASVAEGGWQGGVLWEGARACFSFQGVWAARGYHPTKESCLLSTDR